MEQDPAGGTEAEVGSEVTINVSTGPGEALVPLVQGLPADEAADRMRDAGFRTERRDEYSDTVRRDRVIETSPAEGESVRKGSTITLVVSRGKEKTPVPDVVGRPQAEAEPTLRAAGFEVRTSEREDADAEPGTVLEQDPAAGTQAAEGAQVTLTVATQPAEVAVPDVCGQEEDAARQALEDAGFDVRVVDEPVDTPDEDGVVTAQDPGAGETAAPGQPGRDHRRPLRAARRSRAGADGDDDAGAAGVRVAVLHGGRSSEHPVSLASAEAAIGGIAAAGHEAVPVLLERNGAWLGPDGMRLAIEPGGGLLGADVAFPVLHGPYGEDGTVQGLLELLDVPYVGRRRARLLAVHGQGRLQGRAGRGRRAAGRLRRACARREWREQPDAVRERIAALGQPLFVKPARLGSSVGIAKVHDERELGARARGRLRARRAGDRRGLQRRRGGRVRGHGPAAGRGVRARRGRPARRRRVVRLRGEVLRRRRPAAGARADLRGRRRRPSAGSRSTRSCASAAPGWPASTSSSRTTAACWSTSSTRCPA